MAKIFESEIKELLNVSKPRIAFGLEAPDDEILKSLSDSKKYADITLVGPEAIKDIDDFDVISNNDPETKLATMLAEDEVEGIIRGTIDDFKTYEVYQKLTDEELTFAPSLLEDSQGRRFFLSPLSNPAGWTKEERLEDAENIANFIKEWNVEPQIAVYAGERHETYARKKDIKNGVTGELNKTYEDAEWIVESLKNQGFKAKNWSIDLNVAIEEGCNLHIPVNGMVGNQIFRIILSSGGRILAMTRRGLSRHYEDNSRTEKDFTFHVKWLVALINKDKLSK